MILNNHHAWMMNPPPKRVLHTTCDHQVQIKFPLSAGKPSLREKHSKQLTKTKTHPIRSISVTCKLKWTKVASIASRYSFVLLSCHNYPTSTVYKTHNVLLYILATNYTLYISHKKYKLNPWPWSAVTP